ncbi:uncharacterized protein LOC5505987 [Nematostella vectensis]|uniref:uncharacterized protein LOC5505987 n=1 Tax=Nematostella vectensis TaxID=45351 RepID=UPI0020776C19|nr:uncharacterized protein LOC5505987 [Nematostella vectensis]
MDLLRCFNCHHKSPSHENFFNISEIHKSITTKERTKPDIDNDDKQDGGDTSDCVHIVCADCIYDRPQTCVSCSSKFPLCMFKVLEWFNPMESRICIDCSAYSESTKLLQEGFSFPGLVHQCFRCHRFKYLPSFVGSSKLSMDEVPRECIECQLKGDIVQYKKQLHQRYETKLREDPALGSEHKTQTMASPAVRSYASVVTEGSTNRISNPPSSEDSQSDEDEAKSIEIPLSPVTKLTTFSANLNEFFCEVVLKALKTSFHHLEEKTRLELKLAQLDPELLHTILRDKLIRVSHKFSKQGTQQTLFDDAESRWAYVGTYTAAHASLVMATLHSACFPPLDKFLHENKKSKRTHVCCLGAGPGSEILGLSQFFPSDTEWLLLDNCGDWEHLAHTLLTESLGVPFKYGTVDVSCRLPPNKSPHISPSTTYRKAKLFMFVKFISAVQNLPGTYKYLADLLRRASPGSLFLFIDNAHIQTKKFIEDLVFPRGKYYDHGDFKENEFYTLYTTYAELKSEGDDAVRSSLLSEWVGYISYWCDRWPMLDLRVNVLLAVKKGIPRR